MSVAEQVSGPDLPERVALVRAALPDADRARFDAELDEALDLGETPEWESEPLEVEEHIARYLP